MEATFEQYPHWQRSAAQERDVRQALWGVLLRAKADSIEDPGEVREKVDELKGLVDQILNVAGRAGT